MKRKEVELLDERPNKKAKTSMESVDLNSLPREIHQQIVSFGDDRSKRQMRLANTYWFKLINCTSFHIWLPRGSMMNEMVERLSRYTQPISLTFSKQGLLSDSDLLPISRLTNLTNLKFHNAWLNDSCLHFSTLTNLEFFHPGSTFDRYPLELLNNFTKLRALSTWRLQVNYNKLASAFEKLPNLENVKLIVESEDEIGMMSKIPAEKLTTLEINYMAYTFAFSEADGARFTNLKTLAWQNDTNVVFPISKLTNLVSLKCNSAGHVEQLRPLTGLTHLTLWALGKETNVDHVAQLPNLESLAVTVADDRENFDFLRLLPKLHSLSVESRLGGDFFANIPHEHVTMLEITCYTGETLDARHLTLFSNLQTLKFSSAKMGLNFNAALKQLTRLTRAEIYFWTQAHEDLDLSALVGLEWLAMSRTGPRGAQALQPLTQLRHLKLLLSEPCDFNFLAHKPLKSLELDLIDTPSLWPALATLTALEELELILVDQGEDKLALLSGLTRLTELTLTGRVTGERLTCLTNLQRLNFTTAETKHFYTKTAELTPFMPNLMTEVSGARLSTWRGQEFMRI